MGSDLLRDMDGNMKIIYTFCKSIYFEASARYNQYFSSRIAGVERRSADCIVLLAMDINDKST
jgi:hypothetical protein